MSERIWQQPPNEVQPTLHFFFHEGCEVWQLLDPRKPQQAPVYRVSDAERATDEYRAWKASLKRPADEVPDDPVELAAENHALRNEVMALRYELAAAKALADERHATLAAVGLASAQLPGGMNVPDTIDDLRMTNDEQ